MADWKDTYEDNKESYGKFLDSFSGRRGADAREVDPAETRDVLIQSLEACAINPEIRAFHPGIMQT